MTIDSVRVSACGAHCCPCTNTYPPTVLTHTPHTHTLSGASVLSDLRGRAAAWCKEDGSDSTSTSTSISSLVVPTSMPLQPSTTPTRHVSPPPVVDVGAGAGGGGQLEFGVASAFSGGSGSGGGGGGGGRGGGGDSSPSQHHKTPRLVGPREDLTASVASLPEYKSVASITTNACEGDVAVSVHAGMCEGMWAGEWVLGCVRIICT